MVTGRSALLLLFGTRTAAAFVPASMWASPIITRAAEGASRVSFPQSLLAFHTLTRLSSATTFGGKEESEQKVPITILAGFLGAGKTTALKRLLENTDGIKVGTIVNDVAAVNIDAKLISNPMTNLNGPSNTPVAKGNAGGTVELQNGCACCSLSDELLTSVSDLMEGRRLDAIVVELSGVADPEVVRQNWEAAVDAKHPSTAIADLQRVVTVVDSHTFGTDWMSWDTAKKRQWAEGDECAGSRQVPELLAEQVEAADVIILNKVDLSEGEQLETARLVVRSINEKADLIETRFAEITPDKLLPLDRFKKAEEVSHNHSHSSECNDPKCEDATHSHSHDHQTSSTAVDSLGISNFVYKSSRPFNARKLQKVLMTWPIPVMEELSLVGLSKDIEQDGKDSESPFIGVLRSKGFIWCARPSAYDLEYHDTVLYWSHAGKHFGLKQAGSWWASMGKENMKKVFEQSNNMEEYDRILREDFVSGEWGDRRQEIVFIGAKLDEERIKAALDDCLCTDEQMKEYKETILNAIAEYMENPQ